MSVMDKVVLYVAGTMDLCFLVGYLVSGQTAKALYWFGATVIAVATPASRFTASATSRSITSSRSKAQTSCG